jgi:ornithine carbamoyltransferase
VGAMQELQAMLDTAAKVKAVVKSGDQSYKPLAGKSLAMIFTKPSMRTRISFETVSNNNNQKLHFFQWSMHGSNAPFTDYVTY